MSKEKHGQIALAIMLTLVIGLMQATHYTKASHLMGAFIAGLVFCTDHDLHVTFVSQFKRVLQVRMKCATFSMCNSVHPLILSFFLHDLLVAHANLFRIYNWISSTSKTICQWKNHMAGSFFYFSITW